MTLERALKICRVITVISGVILSLFILSTRQGDTGIIVIYLFFIVLNAVFVPFGLISAFLRPDSRRLALWVAGLPIAFIIIPTLFRLLIGFAFSAEFVMIAALILGIGALIWGLKHPARLVEFLPNRLLTSGVLNVAIVAVLVIGWVLGIAALFSLMRAGVDDGQGSPGMGAATALAALMIYFLFVGAGSALVAVWGWLGLRGGVIGANRKLHRIQIATAVPGLLVAGVAVLALVGN